MLAKYIGDGTPPLTGSTVAYRNQAITVRNEDKLKKLVLDYNYPFEVRIDNEWINANEYFNEDEIKKTTVTAEVEVVDDKVDYDELLGVHWRKRVDTVKDYTSDANEVENILDFAKEDGQPDSVVNGIEEYLQELR